MFRKTRFLASGCISACALVSTNLMAAVVVDFDTQTVTFGEPPLEHTLTLGIQQKPTDLDDIFFRFSGPTQAGGQAGWERDISAMDDLEETLDAMVENCQRLEIDKALLKANKPANFCISNPPTNRRWMDTTGKQLLWDNLSPTAMGSVTGITWNYFLRIVMPSVREGLFDWAATMSFDAFAQSAFQRGLWECAEHYDEVGPAFAGYDLQNCHEQLRSVIESLADDPSAISFGGVSVGAFSFNVNFSQEFILAFTDHTACRAWYAGWEDGMCESLRRDGHF